MVSPAARPLFFDFLALFPFATFTSILYRKGHTAPRHFIVRNSLTLFRKKATTKMLIIGKLSKSANRYGIMTLNSVKKFHLVGKIFEEGELVISRLALFPRGDYARSLPRLRVEDIADEGVRDKKALRRKDPCIAVPHKNSL